MYIRYGLMDKELKKIYRETGQIADFQRVYGELLKNGHGENVFPVLKQRCGLTRKEFMHVIEKTPIPDTVYKRALSKVDKLESCLIPEHLPLFAFKNFNYIEQKEHPHDCFDIVYVFDGSVKLTYSKNDQFLTKGDLCLMAPFSEYLLSNFSNDAIIFSIYIRKSIIDQTFFRVLTDYGIVSEFVRNTLYKQDSPNYLMFKGDFLGNLSEIIQNIFLETSYVDQFSNQTAIMWTHLLFVALIRDFNYLRAFRGLEAKDVYFYEILEYIQNHIKGVSLKSISKAFGYNESYLSTLFKKNFDQSFSSYLKTYRMKMACRLLETTSLTLQEIADSIGYGSVDHFSRTFKKETGMTPGNYRNRT